jgi:hypothetical protein
MLLATNTLSPHLSSDPAGWLALGQQSASHQETGACKYISCAIDDDMDFFR